MKEERSERMNKGVEARKEGRKLSNEKENNEGCKKERQKALSVPLNVKVE